MSEERDGVDLVEMVVESVRVHMLSSQHVVILKELDRDRYLPIWIGPWEANAIAMRLQGVEPERPLTHDLLVAIMRDLGAVVREVEIVALEAETFIARIILEAGGRLHEIDARPSDALAIAVRTSAPVYAAEAVLDRAGVRPEPDEASSDPGDERLSVFRDFVNSLDADDRPREGRGPDA
jgi:bifunctional DNase/RNase